MLTSRGRECEREKREKRVRTSEFDHPKVLLLERRRCGEELNAVRHGEQCCVAKREGGRAARREAHLPFRFHSSATRAKRCPCNELPTIERGERAKRRRRKSIRTGGGRKATLQFLTIVPSSIQLAVVPRVALKAIPPSPALRNLVFSLISKNAHSGCNHQIAPSKPCSRRLASRTIAGIVQRERVADSSLYARKVENNPRSEFSPSIASADIRHRTTNATCSMWW